MNAIPALDDYTQRDRRSKRRELRRNIAAVLLVAAITGICGFFWGQISGTNTQSPESEQETPSVPENG